MSGLVKCILCKGDTEWVGQNVWRCKKCGAVLSEGQWKTMPGALRKEVDE